jgi:hypothetical protein
MYPTRPNLTNQKNWVVVSKDKVSHYETFQEASKDKSGNLMSLTYYQFHYKPIQDESSISRQ